MGMMARQCVEELLGTMAEGGLVPRVALVGVGGAGCNVLSLVHDREAGGLDAIAVNTDPVALLRAHADVKLLVTELREVTPEGALAAAEGQWDRLVALFNHDLVLLLVGLGGATGSGIAPVVAQAAAANGARVMAFTVMPFQAEGRRGVAEAALADLKLTCQSVLVLENENLVALEGDREFRQALALVNEMAARIVEGLVCRVQEQIVEPGEALGDLTVDLAGMEFEAPLGPLNPESEGALEVAPLTIGQGGLIL